MRRTRRAITGAAGLTAFLLPVGFALAPPPPPNAADALEAYLYANAQTLTVSGEASLGVDRDTLSATLGSADLAGGTNYDWARLVLAIGGWPASEQNVTVLTRWMRQENGPNNWWNRNNPLNNGWGSGGNSGTGHYASLLDAARNAAAALHGNPGYHEIVAALSASAPASTLEHAIWASPWATSHYANGAHWSSAPVPEYSAPDGTW